MTAVQRIFWSIFLIFFTGLMVYFNVNAPTPSVVLNVEQDEKSDGFSIEVEKIVGYSLGKQIELDWNEYFCAENFTGNYRIVKNPGFWKKIDNSPLYIASIILDNRLNPYKYLRIIGVSKGNWDRKLYCQILTNYGHVRIIKTTVLNIWYNKWDLQDNNTYYTPLLLSCRLPSDYKIDEFPIGVNLVTNPCNFTQNYEKIADPQNSRKLNFTLCVKPLNFQKDISKHLIEWIELLKILGAQFFYIFIQNVTKNTRNVLHWYQTAFPNMFHLEQFKPLEPINNNCTFLKNTWQRRRYEILTYNKCFQENLNSKYVIPLDIDEIIVPKIGNHWNDLLRNFSTNNNNNNNYTSIITQNVYFFKKNEQMNRYYKKPFFFKETKRTKFPNEKGENGKSFISTRSALTVFNHYALHLLQPGTIKQYFLPFEYAQLNHYKDSCDRVLFPECKRYTTSSTVNDDVISKYKNQFYKEYKYVLSRLKKTSK